MRRVEDLTIAQDLYLKFARREATLADNGFRMEPFFKQPSNAHEKRLLARHESLNGRLKEFAILKHHFRNSLKNIRWFFMPL